MQNKKKRAIFVGIAFLIAISSLAFIIKNFRNEIVFFYSPSELAQNKIRMQKAIRVGGLVLKNSVIKRDALTIEFIITDGEKNLQILHKGLVPDLFRDGQGVIAKGFYDQENKVFLSEELLVKHDEKYMPPEISNSIKHELKK